MNENKDALIGLIIYLLWTTGYITTSVYYGREIYRELDKRDTNQLLSILAGILGGTTVGSIWPITAPIAIVHSLSKRQNRRSQKRRSKKHT